jgi:hypothetical protein
MNWNHANQAWQRRRRDPLSPHVLVFFYAEPAGGQPRYELRTAARLFLAADGQRLAKLLYDMTGSSTNISPQAATRARTCSAGTTPCQRAPVTLA